MFVIADIEWMTNEEGHHSPTQLAAIRVDETWNEVDNFASLIRPRDSEFHDWRHVSYTGGKPTEFMYARNAHNVFDAFYDWLKDDDVILWWYDESIMIFKKLIGLILKKQTTHKMVELKEYVYEHLSGQANSRGNAYKIAEARGIDTHPHLKHNSANDARVVRALLETIELPQEILLVPLVKKEKPMKPSKQFSDLPYQYDPKTNTIHNKECPTLLIGDIETQGYENLKTPLRKQYKPCECCAEEYRTALRERNMDIIDRTQYTYIYSPESKVFHKYTCGLMLQARSILGTIKYDTVVKTGRTPCKVCNPTAQDVFRPLPPQQKIARLKKKKLSAVSTDGVKAIKRQRRALFERNQLLQNEGLTETEKNDAYTLTQPRFAFWVGQGYQTFHLRSCPKLKEVSNLRGFGTYKDAVRAGFTPCRKCKPTAKHDVVYSIPIKSHIRENEKIEDLETLCNDAGYFYHRENAYFCLETAVGKWRIDVSTAPIKLHHINLVKTPGARRYHEQPRLFLSFIDAFDYIKRHDDGLERKRNEGIVFVKLVDDEN